MNCSQRYERFAELIRYLTVEELGELFDSIDNHNHKLMFEVIYELCCRVDEFVKIQVKHINLRRITVFSRSPMSTVRNTDSMPGTSLVGESRTSGFLMRGVDVQPELLPQQIKKVRFCQ